MQIIRDIVTDFDNITGDTGRALTVFVIVSMVIMQGFALFKGQNWDPIAFGSGIGAVLASLAAYLWGDSKSRPGRVTTTVSSQSETIKGSA